MAAISAFPGLGKDPDENLDYSIDFTDVIGVSPGDTITGTPVWSATPSGLTLSSPTLNGNVATTFASGGTEGEEYELSCRIQTTQGRTFVRSGMLKIVQR